MERTYSKFSISVNMAEVNKYNFHRASLWVINKTGKVAYVIQPAQATWPEVQALLSNNEAIAMQALRQIYDTQVRWLESLRNCMKEEQ